MNATFARLLRERFASANVFDRDVETLAENARYDLVVSSLPLMNFEPEKVRRILDLYAARLAPGGTIVSVDYWGKELRPLVSGAAERARMREVLRVTRAFLDRHEHESRIVPWNFPPACVRYVRILSA